MKKPKRIKGVITKESISSLTPDETKEVLLYMLDLVKYRVRKRKISKKETKKIL
jgi:hypothetical protein